MELIGGSDNLSKMAKNCMKITKSTFLAQEWMEMGKTSHFFWGGGSGGSPQSPQSPHHGKP